GQLGDNSTTDRAVPVAVAGLSSGVAAIAAGELHTCAVTTGGAVLCWGDNTFGELGANTTLNSSTPVGPLGLSSGIAAVAAGQYLTCAVTTSGGIQCWGLNDSGQLGNNSTVDSHVPVGVVGLSTGVASVSAGFGATCAVTATGGARCWGNNHSGGLGNN